MVNELFKNELIKEYNLVIEELKNCKDFEEGLYYFSATHAITSRILNFEFDSYLNMINYILGNAQNTITKAVDLTKKGIKPFSIDLNFFGQLAKLLEDLVNKLKTDEKSYEILEKMCVLFYSITGNGFFLQKKGFKLI